MSDNSDFSNTFYEESEFLLSEIESSILDLETSPEDFEVINSLFRAVHTLKGNSGMFGFNIVADLGHLMENVIGRIREGEINSGPELTDVFLSVIDLVRNIFENKDVEDVKIEEVKKGLIFFYEKGDKAGFVEKDKDKKTTPKEYQIYFKPMSRIFHLGLDPFTNIEELQEISDMELECGIEDVPLINEINPEKSYLYWTMDIKTSSSLEELNDVFLFVEDESEIAIDEKKYELANKKSSSKETLSKVSGYLGKHDTNVTISTKKLDEMVNLIGELVMHQSRLSQEVADFNITPLKDMVVEIEESVENLRSAILDLRMTPIGTKFGSFRRLVRDLSGSLGKKVELYTFGEDTELDKSLIEKMWDPLVHLVRNSIDHGVESPHDRVKAGKEEVGRIVVSARTKESRVEVSISDDGKGIDPEIIVQEAIKKNLISEDRVLSKKDILDIVFEPGFSTSGNISEVSGRGVGMDAVKEKVEEVNGDIRLDSVVGEGTTITISLPLTLAIVDVLMIESGRMFFVIPLGLIEECFELSEYMLKGRRKRHLLVIRDTYIPYFRLNDVFGLDSRFNEDEEQVLVVQHGIHKVGIVVDRLVRSQQAVLKSMRKWYAKNDGISGATVLADGSLAYLLDIVQVVRCGLEIEKSTHHYDKLLGEIK